MRDPGEGLTPDGLIRTGAASKHIADRYLDALDAAKELVRGELPAASLYIYGSVATGQAQSPTSDMDLLTIGLPVEVASLIAQQLTSRFGDLCRSVDISPAQPADFVGETDEAYGNRVFLRHYCVHLTGPDPSPPDDFPGNQRAARGFNGDIAQHVERWRAAIDSEDPTVLGRRIARKLLLAIAALVSVHDASWTTDRDYAANRWSAVHPELASDLSLLLSWTPAGSISTRSAVERVLTGVVNTIVDQFASQIGFWRNNVD